MPKYKGKALLTIPYADGKGQGHWRPTKRTRVRKEISKALSCMVLIDQIAKQETHSVADMHTLTALLQNAYHWLHRIWLIHTCVTGDQEPERPLK